MRRVSRSKEKSCGMSILKWLCLSLGSYIICAFVVDVPWREVGWVLIWPPLSLKADYVMAIVAAGLRATRT